MAKTRICTCFDAFTLLHVLIPVLVLTETSTIASAVATTAGFGGIPPTIPAVLEKPQNESEPPQSSKHTKEFGKQRATMKILTYCARQKTFALDTCSVFKHIVSYDKHNSPSTQAINPHGANSDSIQTYLLGMLTQSAVH